MSELGDWSDDETDDGGEEFYEDDTTKVHFTGVAPTGPAYRSLGGEVADPAYRSSGGEVADPAPASRSLGGEASVPAPRKVQKNPPTLQSFVMYGMMQAGDVMQYLVKSNAGTQMLVGTVGRHTGAGTCLIVHLADLGADETQRDTLRVCCARYEEVEPRLSTSDSIAVSVSTFVHIGHALSTSDPTSSGNSYTASSGNSYKDTSLFVTHCRAVGHTDGSFYPMSRFRRAFVEKVGWDAEAGKPTDGRSPGARAQMFTAGNIVYVPGSKGWVREKLVRRSLSEELDGVPRAEDDDLSGCKEEGEAEGGVEKSSSKRLQLDESKKRQQTRKRDDDSHNGMPHRSSNSD